MLNSHSISLFFKLCSYKQSVIEGRRNTLWTARMDNCFNFPTNCFVHQVWKAFGKETTSSPHLEWSMEMKSLLVTVTLQPCRRKLALLSSGFSSPVWIQPCAKGSWDLWHQLNVAGGGKSLGVFTSLHLFCTLLMFPLMCSEHPLEKLRWGCSQVQASFSFPPVLLWR